jgi:hypothetical protein
VSERRVCPDGGTCDRECADGTVCSRVQDAADDRIREFVEAVTNPTMPAVIVLDYDQDRREAIALGLWLERGGRLDWTPPPDYDAVEHHAELRRRLDEAGL